MIDQKKQLDISVLGINIIENEEPTVYMTLNISGLKVSDIRASQHCNGEISISLPLSIATIQDTTLKNRIEKVVQNVLRNAISGELSR